MSSFAASCMASSRALRAAPCNSSMRRVTLCTPSVMADMLPRKADSGNRQEGTLAAQYLSPAIAPFRQAVCRAPPQQQREAARDAGAAGGVE